MKKSITALVLFSMFFTAAVYTQWVETSGPINGGSINCLIKSGSVFWAGTDYGLYSSSDNGENWGKVVSFSEPQGVCSLLQNGNDIYAGLANSLFKSTDGGQTWAFCANFDYASISDLKIHNDAIYACALGSGLYRTPNGGLTWEQLSSGLYSAEITCIFFSGGLIYTGTYDGYYVSSDDGNSWVHPGNEIGGYEVYQINEHQGNLFAATNYGLFRSSNNGANWVNISASFNTSGVTRVDVYNGQIFAGSYNRGMFRSSDDGNTWTRIINGADNWFSASFLAYDNKIYYGTFGDLYFSSDNGDSWVSKSNGIKNLYHAAFFSADNKLYAAFRFSGIYSTSNGGANWNKIVGYINKDGYNRGYFNSVFVKNNFVLTNDLNGPIFYSSDYGATWNLSNILNAYVVNFEAVGDTLYCAGGTKILKSADNGKTWALIHQYTNKSVSELRYGNNKLYAAGTFGIERSSDGGISWESCGITKNCMCVYIDGSKLFAGTWSYGLYYSSDNGANWVTRNQGLPGSYPISHIDVYNNVYFLSGTFHGVYMSTNDGTDWRFRNDGMTTTYNTMIGFNSGNLICGTRSYGVWKRNFDEIINVFNISTEIPGSFSLMPNYPNPFNSATKIPFTVSFVRGDISTAVTIKVFDITGREVKTLVDESLKPGTYETTFNAADLNSGIYFIRMTAGSFTEVRRAVLLK